MAEPKLEIERRLDRIELAISSMARWLVEAQTGFGAQDASRIERILRGEKLEEEDKARTEAHERWEEEDASPEEQGRV